MDLYFFDFDRTLCVHEYPKPGDYFAQTTMLEFINELCKQDTVHKGDRPLDCMQWFTNKVYEQDNVFCLTHTLSNLRDDYNKEFLRKYYTTPFIYLTVCRSELKIDMIQAVAKSRHVDVRSCHLIEDKMETVHKACEAGINGVHVSNIVSQFELYLSRCSTKGSCNGFY